MAKNNNGKAAMAARVGQLIAGTRKRFANGGEKLTLRGGLVVTVDEAVGELQKFVDNRAAVVEAQATAKAKVAAERSDMPARIAFIQAFDAFVKFMFGNDATALADFGDAPPKARVPMTAEQKAVATAKRKATREARGTIGPKAKKNVKGHVTAKLVVTPVTVVEAGAPAAAAAQNGAATTQPKG
jgi:hypothetical protein